jgi:hypothetical protein
MSYYGDFGAGKTVRCRFNTVNASGVPTTLSAGAVIVMKDGTDVTPSGGVTLAADVGAVVGRNHVIIDMSVDPATFTAGSEYAVRLSGTANVSGTGVVGIVVGEWSVANRSVAPQTGDAFARIGANGVGLTNLGDLRLTALDAAISSRSTYAGGPVASVTAPVNLPPIPANWITSAGIAAAALNAKGDWLPASAYTTPPTAAAIVTAVLTTQMTESYSVNGVAPTLTQAVLLCMQRLTEFGISGTALTVRKLDGATTAYGLTLDSASAPTNSHRTS